MKDQTKQLLRAGFKAGWAAAMTSVAEAVKRGGGSDEQIASILQWAKEPDNVEIMRGEPGADGHLVPAKGEQKP